MPSNNQGKTTSVVTFTVQVSSNQADPPFVASNCSASVTFADGSSQNYGSWAASDIGTPPQSGAALALDVVDTAWTTSNQTQVVGWALDFLPGPGRTEQSDQQQPDVWRSRHFKQRDVHLILSTANGSGILKNSGNSTKDWDWSLMVQMQLSDGQTIKCFVSDPEMQMTTSARAPGARLWRRNSTTRAATRASCPATHQTYSCS